MYYVCIMTELSSLLQRNKKKKIKRNWKDWWKSNLWFFFGKLLLSLYHIYSIVMNCMRSLSFINI